MTLPTNLRFRAAAIAEQFRHFKAAHPALDMVGVRGSKLDAIAILRRDELLSVLDAVAQGVIPENDTPHPGESIPLRKPVTRTDFDADAAFLVAIDVYAEAIKAHRASQTKVTGEIVGQARQALIETHLEAAQVRAEAMQVRASGEPTRYQPDPLDRPKADAPHARAISPDALRALETERDAWKAHAFFWKDKAEAQFSAPMAPPPELAEGLAHGTRGVSDAVCRLELCWPGYGRQKVPAVVEDYLRKLIDGRSA